MAAAAADTVVAMATPTGTIAQTTDKATMTIQQVATPAGMTPKDYLLADPIPTLLHLQAAQHANFPSSEAATAVATAMAADTAAAVVATEVVDQDLAAAKEATA